jgi:hypothetical protein
VKGRVLGIMIATIGVFAGAVTGAHASAGGTPSPLTSFFICHPINGDDAGKVVDVESPVFGPNRVGVRIGNGVLGCAWAKLFQTGTTTEIPPNPNQNLTQLKCYGFSVARDGGGSVPPRYTVRDNLMGLAENPDSDVQLYEARYICAPAQFIAQ